MTQYIPMFVMILATTKAGAKHELLFNKPASELCYQIDSYINEDFLVKSFFLIFAILDVFKMDLNVI